MHRRGQRPVDHLRAGRGALLSESDFRLLFPAAGHGAAVRQCEPNGKRIGQAASNYRGRSGQSLRLTALAATPRQALQTSRSTRTMQQKEISRLELARYLICPSLFVMLILMIAEAMLAATTTWFVINAGRKVASGHFLLNDLIWILSAQSTSYVAGVISWIFAERAGYRGFGRFMLRFARENRGKVALFGDKPAREQVEPFLTGEAFSCFFSLIYELEFTLKLFFGLVFNALVLGTEIDLSLPFAYIGASDALLYMGCTLQKPIARTYLENQRMNNRVTAQGYTSWDNVFSGNRYNLRLWLGGL